MLISRKYVAIAIVGAGLATATNAPASAGGSFSTPRIPGPHHCQQRYKDLSWWIYRKIGVWPPTPPQLRDWAANGRPGGIAMPDGYPGKQPSKFASFGYRASGYARGYGYGRAYARMF
jgi:hypothetical protein